MTTSRGATSATLDGGAPKRLRDAGPDHHGDMQVERGERLRDTFLSNPLGLVAAALALGGVITRVAR